LAIYILDFHQEYNSVLFHTQNKQKTTTKKQNKKTVKKSDNRGKGYVGGTTEKDDKWV
jgi:hypothetical protein